MRPPPAYWWNTIDKHLVEIGFKSLKSDPCVYTYSESGAIYILSLYVDDVILLKKDVLVLRRIKQKLMSRFSLTDMGDVSFVLGMGVTRDRENRTVTITQEKYTKSLTSSYHPNGNGGMDRMDHTMAQMLTVVVNELQITGMSGSLTSNLRTTIRSALLPV